MSTTKFNRDTLYPVLSSMYAWVINNPDDRYLWVPDNLAHACCMEKYQMNNRNFSEKEMFFHRLSKEEDSFPVQRWEDEYERANKVLEFVKKINGGRYKFYAIKISEKGLVNFWFREKVNPLAEIALGIISCSHREFYNNYYHYY